MSGAGPTTNGSPRTPSAREQPGEKFQVRADLPVRREPLAGRGSCGGRHRGTSHGLGEQLREFGDEACAITGRNQEPRHSVAEALRRAADFVAHDRQAGALRLDEEIGQRLALRSEHGDGGRTVERRRVGLPAMEDDAVGETEVGGMPFAIGARGALADEGEFPADVCRKCGDDVEQLALVLLPAKLRDAEQDRRLAWRGDEIEQRRVEEGVGDDGAASGGTFGGDEVGAGELGVRDYAPRGTEAAAVQPGQTLTGAHGGDHGGAWQSALQLRGAAVGHAAHAQHDVGRGAAHGGHESRREPVEAGVERLQRAPRHTGGGEFRGERAAGAEGEDCRVVTTRGESAGEKRGLSLGAATAQTILDEENFHCSRRGGHDSRRGTTMNNGFFNQMLRWLFLAMGVALAAKIVPGIHCNDGMTLLVVVVLLSLFNAFLKPLLVLFTLPLVVLSAGFGLWLINAFLLWATSRLVDGFTVRGLGAALIGSAIISLSNMAFTTLFGAKRVRVQRGPRGPQEPPRPTPPPGKGDVIDV